MRGGVYLFQPPCVWNKAPVMTRTSGSGGATAAAAIGRTIGAMTGTATVAPKPTSPPAKQHAGNCSPYPTVTEHLF